MKVVQSGMVVSMSEALIRLADSLLWFCAGYGACMFTKSQLSLNRTPKNTRRRGQ